MNYRQILFSIFKSSADYREQIDRMLRGQLANDESEERKESQRVSYHYLGF